MNRLLISFFGFFLFVKYSLGKSPKDECGFLGHNDSSKVYRTNHFVHFAIFLFDYLLLVSNQ